MVPYLKRLPYSERLKRLGLTTLETRRVRRDLILVFKIFNNLEKVELCNAPMFKSELVTRGHSHKFAREMCSYEPRQQFLMNRVANKWNELPLEVAQAKSVNEFKA